VNDTKSRRYNRLWFFLDSPNGKPMANRLTKITTRTGDNGSTGLGDGSRIQKSAPRVVALGDVDELNSNIGVLLTETMPTDFVTLLTRIQNQLFDLGGEVCIPGYYAVTENHVLFLDTAIQKLNADLTPLKEFILPGGSRASALAHVARTVARRAERSLVVLSEKEEVAPYVFQYINRLSDLLFILARALNRAAGVRDVCWSRELVNAKDDENTSVATNAGTA
jgi:cob(I)alamin adenosyltransferase